MEAKREYDELAEATEWFSVPLEAIDGAIALLEAETIGSYEYDRATQRVHLRG